jgi:peptidoglycan hydrolase CwlO-like protein
VGNINKSIIVFFNKLYSEVPMSFNAQRIQKKFTLDDGVLEGLLYILADKLEMAKKAYNKESDDMTDKEMILDLEMSIKKLNETIKDRKDKIKELQDSIDRYKKQIDQKELEATSLKNQLSILDTRINEVEVEVEITKERLETTRLELSVLGYTIDEKTGHLEKQKSLVSGMVRKIQADDQKNAVEIMLTNPSFADFYGQLKNLEDVYSDLGRSARALRLSRDEIMTKQKEVDDRRKAYEKYQTELENKKQDLHEQVSARENLLTSTKQSEQQYRTLLGSLKQQYQTVEGEVRNYEEQVRKKLEEQKKIKEISTGTFMLHRAWYQQIFPTMPKMEKLGEYGLPTAFTVARDSGLPHGVVKLDDPDEWFGVNTPEELEEAKKRKNNI